MPHQPSRAAHVDVHARLTTNQHGAGARPPLTRRTRTPPPAATPRGAARAAAGASSSVEWARGGFPLHGCDAVRGARRAGARRQTAARCEPTKRRQTILHGPETLSVRPPATTMATAQRERPWSGRGGGDGAVAVSLLPCSPARRARRGVPHLSVLSAVAARPSRGMWWWRASASRLRRSTSPPVVVVVDAPQRPSENRAADWCWCGCAKGAPRLMYHVPCIKIKCNYATTQTAFGCFRFTELAEIDQFD